MNYVQWLKNTFLKWLDKWEEQVNTRVDLKDGDKECRLLSKETMLGIRITGRHGFKNKHTYMYMTQ